MFLPLFLSLLRSGQADPSALDSPLPCAPPTLTLFSSCTLMPEQWPPPSTLSADVHRALTELQQRQWHVHSAKLSCQHTIDLMILSWLSFHDVAQTSLLGLAVHATACWSVFKSGSRGVYQA